MSSRLLPIFLFVTAFFTFSTAVHAEEATAPADPVILKMADGQFYNPTTGKIAPTREALLLSLNPGSVVIVPTSTTEIPPPPAPVSFPLKDAIQKAQSNLQEAIRTYEAEHPKPELLTSDSDWRPMTLALWNTTTDQLTFADVMKNGTKLKWISSPISGVSVKTANGMNSEFVLDQNSNQLVVAVRYPTLKEVKVGKKKRFERHDVVYTPYAENLRKPELIAEGKRVLQTELTAALAKLDQLNVTSRAFPGKLVTQVIDPTILKSLLLIEHADTTTLKNNPTRVTDTFYVTLGANGDHAYGYAKSSAGALGIAQFMPSTYARLVKNNPGAQLNASFEDGMRDLDNTLKAETILLDSMLSELPKDVRASALQPESLTPEFLAASYNGGASRVSKAIPHWDAQFSAPKVSLKELRNQHKTMRLKIVDLQDKIRKSEDAAAIKSWKKQLSDLKVKYAANETQQENYNQVTLRKETIDYVVKFRNAMTLLEQSEQTSGQNL